MFQNKSHRLLIAGFILAVVLIPTTSLLLSQRLKVSQNVEQNFDRSISQALPSEVPKGPPILTNSPSPTPSSASSGELAAPVSLGPNLSFSVNIQGRPVNNQAGKFFVGIAQGGVTTNPTYLLTFTVDMPATGVYNNLSLAGLSIGGTYTAYIKGPAQLAKASTFTLTPEGASLNSGQPLSLISGDLNDDNVIDNSDYTLAQGLVGTTPSSPNWNPLADIDGDGAVNIIDLDIVKNNLGKTGDGGPWYSQPPTVASNSASLNSSPNIGGLEQPNLTLPPGSMPATLNNKSGYWIFVPSQP